jgi:hypothetical protein
MELIITKLLIFAICFASLDIVREIYTFIQCYRKLEPYEISDKRMFGLWVSISYILTIILTGVI